jgi:hypothetical protein
MSKSVSLRPTGRALPITDMVGTAALGKDAQIAAPAIALKASREFNRGIRPYPR